MGGKAIVNQDTRFITGSGTGLRVKHVFDPGQTDMLIGIAFRGTRKMLIGRRMGSLDTTVSRRRLNN